MTLTILAKFFVPLQPVQGERNLPVDKAQQLAGSDPDYAIRDLYNHIAEGKFPSWNLYIQVMTFKEAEEFRWNPFDVTKVVNINKFNLTKNNMDPYFISSRRPMDHHTQAGPTKSIRYLYKFL